MSYQTPEEVFSSKESRKKYAVCGFVIALSVIIFLIGGICACFAFTSVRISRLESEISTHQDNDKLSQLDQRASPGMRPINPASSCAAILRSTPSSPSSYYWVKSSNDGSVMHVYCDMTRSCGNITGRWMRVAELDMTDSSNQCPSGLRLGTDCPVRTCIINFDNASCSSVFYASHDFNYTSVCGMIGAYQKGIPDSFRDHGGIRQSSTIDSNFIDGISLTHGAPPRQQIWTLGVDACMYI